MLLRFIRYYKPHWRLFALDMTCSLVVAVCDLFYPMIAKDIINVYVPQRNLHALLLWAGILFGIYLLKACLTYVIQYWGHMVGTCDGICSGICKSSPSPSSTKIRPAPL